MADETFDALIVGGGTKALFLAMHLTKYANMTVGIFERRHEIGGGLATEESAAPGFRGNTHAAIQLPWYYVPLWRDFPEFWDYGARIDQHVCSTGGVFIKDQTYLGIYSDKHDPGQERTAKELTCFSERDAESWLKLRKLWFTREVQHAQMDMLFNPAETRFSDPGIGERQLAVYPHLEESGFLPDSLNFASSHLRVAREYWESPEMQYVYTRFVLSSAFDVTHPGCGMSAFGYMGTLPKISFARGGTHQVAHAANKILVGDGCKLFTHCKVDRVVIENGEAKGIRLSDSSEIKANKLVVSTLSPQQLVNQLIGREYFNHKALRRVDLLETTFACLMWYTLAIHEAPKYEAAAFNPDIYYTYWLGLSEDADPEHVARECHYIRLGLWPPLEDYCPTVWCHSVVDPSYAPPGKHAANNEQLALPATAHSEREWLGIKKKYAEDLITVWQRHAPNMTWDNLIGIDCNTPYDNCRLLNMAPNGTMTVVDHVPYQFYENRPTPELTNHRLPVKNIYATGAAWPMGANSGSTEAYNFDKIIAKDMNLPVPWQEPGKEEPESLYQQWLMVLQKMGYVGKEAAE